MRVDFDNFVYGILLHCNGLLEQVAF